MIDAKNCLNENSIKLFVDTLKDNDMVLVLVGSKEVCTCTKNELCKTFTENEDLKNAVAACTVKTDITFAGEAEILVTTTEDYNWWNESTRRINKLFKCFEVVQEVIENRIVACAVRLSDGTHEDIVTCKTSVKSAVTAFFNAEFRRKLIKSYMKANVVFCMNYDETSEGNQWYTFDELIDRGLATAL